MERTIGRLRLIMVHQVIIVMTWIKVSLKCTLVFVDDVMTGSDENRTIANKNRERRDLPGDGDKCCAT